MTHEHKEIEDRFAQIDSLTPEVLSREEEQSLAEAEAMDDGTAVTLDEFQRRISDYSGKLNIRIPRSLHQRLTLEAKADGVSLNQYILYKLAQ